MSDHVKASEQRKEERRAGAVDSTKDQAPSKDSLVTWAMFGCDLVPATVAKFSNTDTQYAGNQSVEGVGELNLTSQGGMETSTDRELCFEKHNACPQTAASKVIDEWCRPRRKGCDHCQVHIGYVQPATTH